MLKLKFGFYTSSEFDLTKVLNSYKPNQILELGRSCVHKDYRNGKIMTLLWKKRVQQLIKKFKEKKLEFRTKIVSAVIRSLKLPPRFRLKLVKEDPVRLELTLTPSYGKSPIIVGLVESLDLVARRDREGRLPRDLQGTWDWTVRHGKVSTGGWNPMLKEALQTMFETGLPAIVYEELTGDEYRPVDGVRHIK